MAATNRPAPRPGAATDDEDAVPRNRTPSPLARLVSESTPEAARALAFWIAIVLPFLHVPLLASGLETTGEWYAFIILLATNAAALYVGHGYAAE